MKNKIVLGLLITLLTNLNAQDILPDKNLTDDIWTIWLDKNAEWENDKLYMPPVDIGILPVNAPTCGWDKLEEGIGKKIILPATVEQYFWGENGDDFGITGNYVGVSWFSTDLFIPAEWEEKRIILDFESVRLRAEVYVNREIAGYDLINGTPFKVDISKFVTFGENNKSAVRITDPNGNFAWRDWETYMWGDYQIPPSHGFGGITGAVKLEVTDNTYISDVYIKNKPSISEVDVNVELQSQSNSTPGQLILALKEKGKKKELWEKRIDIPAFSNKVEIKESLKLDDCKFWSLENPNLYTITANFESSEAQHSLEETFGFRWFEVREVKGDKQFYLNNKRVVLRTAISWGHWPVNGIFPTAELAKKQIQTAKSLGLNMLNFHRGIGQNIVFDYADELGLLYYEEPGGYRPGEGDEFAMAFKREKLLRMVKRDRNHPSLVIYNMINESNRDPEPNEIRDIQDAHKLDETRIITFTSTYFGKNLHGGKAPFDEAKVKMHMLPYDHEVKYFGWYDEHHAGGPGVYRDHFYNGPEDFLRYVDHPKEIIFWGEEGAVGAPPRLELVQKSFAEAGNEGWDGDTYRKMYRAYDNFLSEKGFKDAFPSIESLTKSMGEVSHYYQARIIENIRVGNLTDGYAVNGWENTKVENHSGVVDIYRNPKADPSIMSYYNQPLYLAVKLRGKVAKVGEELIADFYIVNEKDIKGTYSLDVDIQGTGGTVLKESFEVNVTGGDTFGELLKENVKFKLKSDGYTFVNATLKKGKDIIASGQEAAYGVKLHEPYSNLMITVLDTSKVMQKLLDECGVSAYNSISHAGAVKGNVLLVGKDLQPGLKLGQFRMNDPVMDWVSRGNNLLILNEPENWGEYLSHKEIADYRGHFIVGTNWFGGNFFVMDNPYFKGLPVNTAFIWEYQCLAGYNMHRVGLRLENGECFVGINADHKHEVFSAFTVIPYGSGKIILSTLDLAGAIQTNASNNVVAKKILQNILSEVAKK